jgi:hypothetical protein
VANIAALGAHAKWRVAARMINHALKGEDTEMPLLQVEGIVLRAPEQRHP